MRTIFFASLGCPKNTVDTERMLGLAVRHRFEPVSSPGDADVIVVNTCGFIEAARAESIDTVLELASFKARRCSCLILAGCLAQRHAPELATELPEVDHIIGTTDLARLDQILAGQRVPRISVSAPEGLAEADYPRRRSGPSPSTYLKISEGCDRRCAFCSIPAIRGRQRSRTIASLADEAEQLAVDGARELVLVAQDTTAYGRDLRPAVDLVALLEALNRVTALRWIRLLYAYPTAVDATLCAAIAQLDRVVPYLDVPLQHVDDGVLARMRRGHDGQAIRRTLGLVRATIPGVFLRSTVLVGHPGETEAAHRRLLRFVEEQQLDHLGAFAFSPEEGTAAADQPDQVPPEVVARRLDELLALQRAISRDRLRRLRGRTVELLVEGPSDESEYLLQARHAGQAPEIDGVVLLADADARPGDFVRAEITDSADYDLVAHQIP